MSGLVCGSALLACHASRPPRRRISRTTAAKPIRGCAPPWAFASAPVLSACSRALSASSCHASLASRPVAFPSARAGLRAALRPSARPHSGPGSPARRLSASYLISLLVLPARNWDTSPVLFSSLYRPGTAAYRAAQVTRSSFQVISLGAWAWLSAPGPKPTQGMP